MADWTPLTEEDPIPGDPDALVSLVIGLRNDMRELWTVVGELQGINAAGIWSGEAAEAFTRRREGVVPNLDRVANRLDRAAFALETFGQAVHESQFRALEARTKARAAQETITGVQRQIEETARQQGASITPDWSGAIATGEEAMAAARLLFDQACEVYTEAETRCDKILADAIHDDLTDPKKRSLLGSVAHAVGNIADHFTDLEKFSDLLGATAAVVGVASMVPGLQFLAPVGLVTSGLKTLVDINLAATGRQGWGEVGKDALGLALFGASRVATVAARGSVANKAVGELKAAKSLARIGKIDEIVKKVEDGGPLLTGKTAYRFITKRSPKLLETFGDDQFAGRFPSWRRSLYAMRHLDLKLPEAETLRIVPRAVKWAFVAHSIDLGGAVMGSRELGNIMDNSEEERPR